MIRVQRSNPTFPSWMKWRASCAAKTAELLAQFAAGERAKVTGLYKKQKAAIAEMFNGKCAFCEKKILSTQPGDVDHFRPKNAVLAQDWTEVTYQRSGRTGKHLGYYWLAYDSENLILTCNSCNQVSIGRKWGKGARFPVAGFRAEEPGEEVEEDAMLLDPCRDDPEGHIAVDETGVLSAVGNSAKGKTTIAIFGLNERGLPKERNDKFQATLDRINIIIGERRTRGIEETKKKLKDLTKADQEFTLVVRAAASRAAAEMDSCARTLKPSHQ